MSVKPIFFLRRRNHQGEVILMRIPVGKRIGILFLLVTATLFALSGLSKTYADENIEVTSENFFDVKSFHGNLMLNIKVETSIIFILSTYIMDLKT
jgi:hypothetical protein